MKHGHVRGLLDIGPLLLLTLSLTGCYQVIRMGPSWLLTIDNETARGSDGAAATCAGGLTASVTSGALVTLTLTAAPGEWAQADARHDGSVRIGDPVTLEATCSGEGGQETGYSRIEGRIITPPHSQYGGGTYVVPSMARGSGIGFPCLTSTEVRGEPPCITEPMVVPN